MSFRSPVGQLLLHVVITMLAIVGWASGVTTVVMFVGSSVIPPDSVIQVLAAVWLLAAALVGTRWVPYLGPMLRLLSAMMALLSAGCIGAIVNYIRECNGAQIAMPIVLALLICLLLFIGYDLTLHSTRYHHGTEPTA